MGQRIKRFDDCWSVRGDREGGVKDDRFLYINYLYTIPCGFFPQMFLLITGFCLWKGVLAGWFCEFTGSRLLQALQIFHRSLNPPTSWIIQNLPGCLLLFSNMSATLSCKYVCVCERERERETHTEKNEHKPKSVHMN